MTTENSSLIEENTETFKRKKKTRKKRSKNLMKVISNFFLCRGYKSQYTV